MTSARQPLTLKRLDGLYAVCRYSPGSPPPPPAGGLFTVTHTPEELSVVCAQRLAPDSSAEVKVQRDFACFKVRGPLQFSHTGILAALTTALADEGIPVFALSTYDTDFLLVPNAQAEAAVGAWRARGHTITGVASD